MMRNCGKQRINYDVVIIVGSSKKSRFRGRNGQNSLIVLCTEKAILGATYAAQIMLLH